MTPAEALENQNVKAFLATIRNGEGTSGPDGYRKLFGGKLFDGFVDHPRSPQTYKLKGKPLTSTAAGAYQFLSRTWDGLVKKYRFPDFSPQSQDEGAIGLIIGRGALDDVVAGRFVSAVRKCNKEWASLPESPYGQPTVTMAVARAFYLAAGGTDTGPFDPGEVSPTSQPQGANMPPFLLAALPSLLNLVPKLGEIFGSGQSEVAQRNVKALEVAVNVAKEAVGAANEQELIEKVQADPAAAAAVQAAVTSSWYEIQTSAAGIDDARKANAASPEFWKQPAIWVTLLLMPIVYFVVWRVLTGEFSSEVQSMVIAGVISGVLSAITGFWMGTSFSSSRKTELANK